MYSAVQISLYEVARILLLVATERVSRNLTERKMLFGECNICHLFCSGSGEKVAALRADGERADREVCEDVQGAVLVVPVHPGGELLLRVQPRAGQPRRLHRGVRLRHHRHRRLRRHLRQRTQLHPPRIRHRPNRLEVLLLFRKLKFFLIIHIGASLREGVVT